MRERLLRRFKPEARKQATLAPREGRRELPEIEKGLVAPFDLSAIVYEKPLDQGIQGYDPRVIQLSRLIREGRR